MVPSSSGETDLQVLLASMSPVLGKEEYVFCTFPTAEYGSHAELEPIAAVSESEGLTLVVPRGKADQYSLPYTTIFSRITLEIHSSLEAVGLTAAFARKLADKGLSANVMAGFYHDHIFVPSTQAQDATVALRELSSMPL